MTNAKILIVQNDNSAAAHLEGCLQGLGYAVCGPASGRQAIGKAAGTRPDLALIDLGLEGDIDGIEAARQIGSFDVPVIYLTDGTEANLLQRAPATHPFGYVLKPVAERQLHLNIQTALSMWERESRHRETEGRLEQTIDDLRSQVQLMETVFGSMNEGMVVADAMGRILLANPSAEQITGMEVEEQTGNSRPDKWPEIYGVFHLDKQTHVSTDEFPLVRALQGEATDEMEVFIRNEKKPDGIYVSGVARPLLSPDGGEVKGGVAIFRDITRIKQAEAELGRTIEELQDQTKFMETVFESMSEGMAVADAKGRLLLCNSRMEQIIGMGLVDSGPEEWSSTYGAFYLDGETLVPTGRLPLVRALQGEATDAMEMFIRNEQKPDGVYISVSGRPIFIDDGGEVKAGVVVFSDITRYKAAEIKLSKTVARLKNQTQIMKTVFDSMSDGVVATDKNGNYLFSNSRAYEIGGKYLPSRRMDQWAQDYGIFTPDKKTLLPMDENPLVRALRGEAMDGVELFLCNSAKPDGVHISVSTRPLVSKEGTLKGGVMVVRDNTQYKETQTKLQQTIDQLQSQTQLMETVFNSMSDGVVVADAKGKFTIFNPSAERIVGIGMLEISPDQWTDRYGVFFTDEKTHVPTSELPLVRAMEGKSVDEMELFIRNEKKPEGVYISVSGRPLEKDTDEGRGGVIVFRDITAHRKAQVELTQTMEEMRNQNELMETTFNSIRDGIVVADAKGDFLYVNPGAEQIVGMGATDTSPGDWAEKYGTFYTDRETSVPTEDLPLVRAIFGGESTDEVDLFIRNEKKPDGVYIRVSGRPLLNDIGGVRGGVIIFRDVTEQMLAEEALARAFAQGRLEIVDTILHNIGNAINSVTTGIETVHQSLENDRLVRRLSALGEALRAHRDDWIDYIRNDAQGRKVMPFIIALAEDSARQNEALIKTVKRVRDRANLIADVVRTQKALGSLRMDRKDIDLRNAFSSAIKVLQDSLDKRGIRIDVDCENAPKEIRVQESQFHQMMVNLIKNSIEAIDELATSGGLRETPRMRIRAYVEEDFLHLDVSDNGIGFAGINPKVLFTAGYTTKKSGSGLGLHSIANFVVGSGGQIHPLSDGIGKGATMRIMLRLSSVIPPR